MTTPSTCPQCDAPVPDGALYCGSCGVDVTMHMAPEPPGISATDVVPRLRSQVRETLRDATLGDYEILHELGRGGMATVFLAHDISLDRRVAIKVIAPHLFEGEGMAERFKLEARTAAQLSHPHIIPIYAVRETESTLFFVMKHVEGRGLEEIIDRRAPLPIPMVKEVLTRVGEALGYAHARGVVHRDVKPANILIDESGMPVVTDFGIAKVAEGEGLTMTGATMGTPSYMSPEQCEAGVISGASDQYSLGVVAYQMLTGRLPFEATNPFAVMYKHCHEPLPPLEELRDDLPPEIVTAVTRMLEKDPTDRWPSMEAAVQMLSSGGTDPAMATVRTQLIALANDADLDAWAGAGEPATPPGTPAVTPPAPTRRQSTPPPGARVPAGPPAAAAEPPRSRAIGIGVAVVAIVASGVLAVTRPWEDGEAATAPSESVATQPTSGVDGSPVDGAPDRTTVIEGGNVATDADGQTSDVAVSADGETAPSSASAATSGGTPAAGANPGSANPPPTPTVTTVRIEGLEGSMEVGDEAVAGVVALDQSGGAASSASAVWTSSDPAVLRVDATGRVTAVAPGSATVSVGVSGVSAQRGIEVTGPVALSVSIEPATLNLQAGERGTLGIRVRDGNGSLVSDADVRWTSNDPRVARVTDGGEVVGEAAGSATVTASVGGVVATASVSVSAPVLTTRESIEQLIDAYARALESGDLAAIRRAYPGITPEQARDLEAALSGMENLRADLVVQSVDERGDVATAAVSGTYSYINAANGRREQPTVSFTATFERAGDGWRLLQTR